MTTSATSHDELIERARGLAPRFAQLAPVYDRDATAPREQIDALHAADLLRLTTARRDGGHGAGLAVAREVVGAIARGDPSVALILTQHYAQHAAIARARRSGKGNWPDALVHRLTREPAGGIALINAAQVEPELGSPSYGGLPATTARRDGDHWRITGRKRYVTGVPLLSWINVLAITREDEPRLGHFLVPRDAPGVQIVPTWDPIGMRATVSHDVQLDAVAIPVSDAVDLQPARLGLQRDPDAIAWYLNLIGSVYDGAARAAFDWLTGFLKTRKPTALGGAPLSSVPAIQDAVGRIALLLQANEWLLRGHALALDAGGEPPWLAGTVKHLAVDHAIAAVEQALELTGNHGIARRNPLERHHRDVLCARIHAPSNALLRGNFGKAALA